MGEFESDQRQTLRVGYPSRDQLSVEDCLFGLSEDSKERMAALKKIHRQFGHPREETMISLLKNVKCYDQRTKEMLVTIHKQFKQVHYSAQLHQDQW